MVREASAIVSTGYPRASLERIADFTPAVLVIALGFDPGKGDPTGTWGLRPQDFYENGKMIGALEMRTLIIQEGGYRTRTLGANARFFFEGLVDGRID